MIKKTLFRVVGAGTVVGVTLWALFHGIPNTNIRMVGTSEPASPLKILNVSDAAMADVAKRPKNIIVFIADGMGFSHLHANSLIRKGVHGKSAWENFDIASWHTSHPVNGLVIDSAAAATALATGHITDNGSVGVGKDDQTLTTLLQKAAALGYETGVVTDSYVWDATPASFSVNSRSRKESKKIVEQLVDSKLDVLFGAVRTNKDSPYFNKESLTEIFAKRYQNIEKGTDISTIDKQQPLSMLLPNDFAINDNVPVTLLDLTKTAIDRLSSKSDRGFVLLVESEEPDSASHYNDFNRLMSGMSKIEDVIAYLLQTSKTLEDTLIVFTADHETGGLVLTKKRTNNAQLEPIWSTSGHTASVVPLFVNGTGAESFSGLHANHEIGQMLLNQLWPQTGAAVSNVSK